MHRQHDAGWGGFEDGSMVQCSASRLTLATLLFRQESRLREAPTRLLASPALRRRVWLFTAEAALVMPATSWAAVGPYWGPWAMIKGCDQRTAGAMVLACCLAGTLCCLAGAGTFCCLAGAALVLVVLGFEACSTVKFQTSALM